MAASWSSNPCGEERPDRATCNGCSPEEAPKWRRPVPDRDRCQTCIRREGSDSWVSASWSAIEGPCTTVIGGVILRSAPATS
jgi:hypothetical protein